MLVLGSCTTTVLFTVGEQICTEETVLQGHQSKPGASNQLSSPATTEKFYAFPSDAGEAQAGAKKRQADCFLIQD